VIEPKPASDEAMTTPDLLNAAASDRCASCNVPLASDQRYCVNCGERRGKPRFVYQSQTASAPASTAPHRDRPNRAPAGLTLVAGVATLLLAMGVGVLIGQNSTENSRTVAAQTPAITINGGGTAAGTSTTASASTGAKKSGKGANSGAKAAHLTKKVLTQVNNAASNVVGSQAHLAPATVNVGGKCASGQAGCQNGKFTGNFFGGG
jgi:hypothetical protein